MTTDRRNRPSPRQAIAWGLFTMAMGGFVALSAGGLLFEDAERAAEAPSWVGFCAGLIFVLGGLALIVGYGLAGGVAPNGEMPPATPFWVRTTQQLLALGIVGLMAAVFS